MNRQSSAALGLIFVVAAGGLAARAEGLGLPWPKFRPTRWVTR